MTKDQMRTLLNSTIHVLGTTSDGGASVQLQTGSALYGTDAIPFFSSLEVMQQSIQNQHSYLSMPTRDLLTAFSGHSFVFNPVSADRQEFSSELAKQLLDGSYFAPVAVQTVGSKFRSILGLKK
jgi:hypothetical protein